MTEQLPPLPGHPEPHSMKWSELERQAINEYGEQCARAALAANEKVPSRATDIATALALPGCERLREWAEIGPVQRAAVEEFAYALAAKVPADLGTRLVDLFYCAEKLRDIAELASAAEDYADRLVDGLKRLIAATPAPAPEADPCLVLWKAMNQAGKVGSRTDDKLIVEFLRSAGYGIAAATPAQAQQAEPHEVDIVRSAVAAMPHTNPAVADDLLSGFTMHTEMADVVAIYRAGMAAATPAPAPEDDKLCLIEGACKHGNWCSEVYCQEHCKFVKEEAPAQAQQAEPLQVAAHQAIAALERIDHATEADRISAADALRAALKATPAQAQQAEGYLSQSALDWLADPMRGQAASITTTIYKQPVGGSNTPIYTATPAQAQQPRLLPCPFCGSHVIAREGYHMTCLTCGAEGTEADEATDKAAAAAWNRRAKAKPEAQQPLGEAQLEAAYREIWRNKPAHFGFTTSDWITAGIRYAEKEHGIGASGEAT